MRIQRARGRRTVRIYISSTFRDMEAERDHLVRVVFPELRERCAERGLELVEVDLRWGITGEEPSDIAEILFSEIEWSRPFFLGLLGARYGWIPEVWPTDVIARYPECHGKSIMELEFVHGALGDPQYAEAAAFCVRDNAVLESIPEEIRFPSFRDLDGARAARVAHLKQRIYASGLPVLTYAPTWSPRDNKFVALEQFGQWVLDHFWRRIDELYPGDEILAPHDAEDLLQEGFAGRNFAPALVSPDILRRLTSYVEETDNRPVVVCGPDRAARLAAMATLSASIADSFPTALVVSHFVGASPDSTNLRAVLSRLTRWLSKCAENEHLEELPAGPGQLRRRFWKLLEQVATRRKIVLILAELDQIDRSPETIELLWLPRALPSDVKVILSLRTTAHDESEEKRDDAAAQKAGEYGWLLLHLPPLSSAQVTEYVAETLSRYGKRLIPRHIQAIAAKADASRNDYLQLLLHILRMRVSSLETVRQEIDRFPGAIGPAMDLYLDLIEATYGQDLVAGCMGLMACCPDGVEKDRLERLIDTAVPSPSGRGGLDRLLGSFHDFLLRRGLVLDFADREMWRAVRRRYLADRTTSTRHHGAFANSYYATAFDSGGTVRQDVDPLVLRALPFHLQMAGNLERLQDVLTDFKFLRLKAERVDVVESIDAEGQTNHEGYFRVLEDLEACIIAARGPVIRPLLEIWRDHETDFISAPEIVEPTLFVELGRKEHVPVRRKYDRARHTWFETKGPLAMHCEEQRVKYETSVHRWIGFEPAWPDRGAFDHTSAAEDYGPRASCPVRPYEGNQPFLFVSYSHKDTEVVCPVMQQLERAGCRVWYDEGIRMGQDWPKELAGHLDGSRLCLVFVSTSAIKSKWVRKELYYAAAHDIPTYCIYLERITLPKETEFLLGETEFLERSEAGFQAKLVEAIQERLRRRGQPDSPASALVSSAFLAMPERLT